MPITSEKLKTDIERELDVLGRVINYAEKMLFEHGDRSYGAVRRLAYGKSVIIDTENAGTLEFRLAYSSQVLTEVGDAGYATPHSSVGRLCGSLHPGDEDETPKWGWYRVREVRLLDRYDGAFFEPNVRNFLSMKVEGDDGKARVENLLQTLARLAAGGEITEAEEDASTAIVTGSVEDCLASQAASGLLADSPPEVDAEPSAFVVIEDDEEAVGELEDDDPGAQDVHLSMEGHFGLSESFYVNRTRQQDAVMSRSPVGPMFVQGVAGSGKTSAALGRTKMLCDFNGSNLDSEAEFRQIVGDKLDYWSAKFAGKFSQEGSIGFVRTGELIQYLKETCRRLELPHLPVQEYPELRSRLRVHRKLERARPGRGRWSGFPLGRTSHVDTTMAWLHAADKALARYWSDVLFRALPTEEALVAAFTPEAQTKARRVARHVLAAMQERLAEFTIELADYTGSGFALDKLAVRLTSLIEEVRKDILSKDVVWVTVGGRTLVSRNEQEIARQLVKSHAALHLRTQARLVFLEDGKPVDSSLTLINRQDEPLDWSEETKAVLESGHLSVRDAAGRKLPAVASSADHLYLRLLPEATERIYVADGNALRALNLTRGLGRERLDLDPGAVRAQSASQEDDAIDDIDAQDMGDADLKRRSMDGQFNTVVRRAFLKPLTYLADAYADTLVERPEAYPDADVAMEIGKQLKARKLADADIDLLLCLAHLIGRDYKASPHSLSELPRAQAVFIDEVQDFTEQQVYLMAQQADPEYRAVTLVGDIAQKLHNGSTIDVGACFPRETLPMVQLTDNMRQLEAPGLAWFSACFRAIFQEMQESFTPTGALAERLIEFGHQLRGPELLYADGEDEMVETIISALRAAKPHQTAAVLLPDAKSAAACYEACKAALAEQMIDAELSEKIDLSRRHVRHFTSVANAKGLEFDVVVVPSVESYRLEEASHVNRLYVALTRARSKLVLMSSIDRPESKFDHVWGQYEDALTAV